MKRSNENQNLNLVFVYGTLKNKYGNNHLLADSEYVEDDWLSVQDYLMVSFGGFPALFERKDLPKPFNDPLFPIDNDLTDIKGEIWKPVNDEVWRMLDRLEGHPDWYRRQKRVTMSGALVWVYIMSPEYLNIRDGQLNIVTNGIW